MRLENLKPFGRFQYARDHGAKVLENISRTAALLTYAELGEGEDVTLGILEDAVRIILYFSDIYLSCFEVLPENIRNATVLNDYLQSEREDGKRYVRKNRVRQNGPYRLRSKKQLDQAIETLVFNGLIATFKTQNGMQVLDLYPKYGHDPIQWQSFCAQNKHVMAQLPTI